MDKELKIFALEYVKLHDHLLKEQKLAIGQFIMEASDDQVKYMLVSGEVKDKLTEEDKNLFEAMIGGSSDSANSGVGAVQKLANYLSQHGVKSKHLVGAALAGLIISYSYWVYKDYLSKAARACKDKRGKEKAICMKEFKKKAQAAKIQALQAGMSKCAKTKDPTSCKSKLQGKINKEKAKMGAL